MSDALQKAQERLTLHELIRVGVGRQEDLRLLQNVAMQAACLPQASVAQLLREAALREEWRSGRESSLLASLRSQSLRGLLGSAGGTGCLSAADGRLLAEQVAAFTEMMEQQQQRRRQRVPASQGRISTSHGRQGPHHGYGRASGGGASPRSSPGAIAAGTTGGRLSLAPLGPHPQSAPHPAATWAGEGSGRPRTSSAGTPLGPLMRSASAGAAYGPSQQQQKLQQRPSGSSAASATNTAAAMTIYGATAKTGAVAGSPVRTVRGSSGGGGGAGDRRTSGTGGGASWIPMHQHQHRQDAAQPAAAAGSPFGRGRHRPDSAPDGALGGNVDSAAAVAAAAAAAVAAAVNAPDGGAGGGGAAGRGSAGPGQRCSGFRNLLRLQQLLMQGLREHAEQDGEGGAMEALEASVAEGQAFFADCLAEAMEAAGLPPDAAGSPVWQTLRGQPPGGRWGGATGLGTGTGSPSRRLPPVAWDRLLRLGQLGLTRAEVARLEGIRRQQAARTIQRQVRRWLRHRRHQRRVAQARARAEAMQRRLRERAATVIQAWVRGHLARRLAARLAAQAAKQRAAQRLQDTARTLAATRIQRAWRARRRAARYAAAMARAEERRLREAEQQRRQQQRQQGPGEWAASFGAGGDGGRGQVGAGDGGGRQQNASMRPGGGAGPSAAQVERAVVVIQAHLRGWLVRRSTALWWVRASHTLRERRAAVRAWQQHQRFMEASYDLQAQMLGAMVREAQVVEALQADRRRQESEMQAAFNDWLVQQQRVALSQPLPRGWVPHPHPEDPSRMCFLNTRTGDLHSLHPALSELARHAQEQHAAAAAALTQRFSGVPAYVQRLHAATEQQAAIAMKAIAVMYQRAAGGSRRGAGR